MPKFSTSIIFSIALSVVMSIIGMFYGNGDQASGLTGNKPNDPVRRDIYVRLMIMPEVCDLSAAEADAVVKYTAEARSSLSRDDLRMAESMQSTQAASAGMTSSRDAACDSGFKAMEELIALDQQ